MYKAHHPLNIFIKGGRDFFKRQLISNLLLLHYSSSRSRASVTSRITELGNKAGTAVKDKLTTRMQMCARRLGSTGT